MNENNRAAVQAEIFAELRQRAPHVDWTVYGAAAADLEAETAEVAPDEADGFLTLHGTLTSFVAMADAADWAPSVSQLASFVASLEEHALLALADRQNVLVVAEVALAAVPEPRRLALAAGLFAAADAVLNLALALPLSAGLEFRVDELGVLEFRHAEDQP